MNLNEICFVTCVNNDEWYRECLLYIQRLEVPEGYTVSTAAVRNAASMAGGLNKAMRESNAKYKVYLQEDVFIIYPDFLKDVLRIFQNPDIGMIGVVGSAPIPPNGIWWEAENIFGKVYDSHRGKLEKLSFREVDREYAETDCVDGLLLVTQYDIPWREDLFTGWYFYDLSQCREFTRQNYKVVVPRQAEPWCIHDCGVTRAGDDFHQYRQVFVKEYFSKE